MSGSTAPIALRSLTAARWVMIAITAGLGLVFGGWAFDAASLQLLGGRIEVVEWYGILAGWAALTAAGPALLARFVSAETASGLQLAADGLIFTALFAVSRGAANPFTTLYFVPIMLATQVSPRWTWIVAAVCLSGFGSLFALGSTGHEHHFAAHLRGMWLAFAVSGVVITFFVHRIALAIARQQRELFSLREQALRDRQLAQVGSLAAGAAHELGSPLATLNVLVGELDSMSGDERREAVGSMRSELARCKQIIGSMANAELRAGAMRARELEPWPAAELAAALAGRANSVKVAPDLDLVVAIPMCAVLEIVDELIENALSSGAGPGGVTIAIRPLGRERIELEVADDGHGMTAEVAEAAADPFFTTRDGDGHMGLGLFLAEAKARQIGGALTIDSKPGAGTRVSLQLPAAGKGAP